MIGAAHRLCQIALIDGFVLLLLRLGIRWIEGRAFLGSIFHLEMLGRVARLLERLGDDHGDRLTPEKDLGRTLLRCFASGSLRCARRQALVVDNGKDSRHCERRCLVDRHDLAPHDRRGDDHALGCVFDPVFGSIRRRPGHLRQPLDPRNGLAEHALFHRVEKVVGIGFVLLEMGGHIAVSVASANTAASVRRASGILKSFSP